MSEAFDQERPMRPPTTISLVTSFFLVMAGGLPAAAQTEGVNDETTDATTTFSRCLIKGRVSSQSTQAKCERAGGQWEKPADAGKDDATQSDARKDDQKRSEPSNQGATP